MCFDSKADILTLETPHLLSKIKKKKVAKECVGTERGQ